MSYNNKSIKELHELLVNKEISALELTKATLSDISAREPQIDAFLKITEEKALQDAAAIDARGINPDVVTDGISIAVKDNIVTEGIETTAASKILGGWIPPYNATVANKLSESGLITIGKLNMDEFAMGGSGENSSVKPTKTLGIKQKYLVVLHLVLRLQLLLVKFVYHWVQILVAQFANLPHSMGLLV